MKLTFISGKRRPGRKRPVLGPEQFSNIPAWWEGRKVLCEHCKRSLVADRKNCLRVDTEIYVWCHDCRELTVAVNLIKGIP